MKKKQESKKPPQIELLQMLVEDTLAAREQLKDLSRLVHTTNSAVGAVRSDIRDIQAEPSALTFWAGVLTAIPVGALVGFLVWAACK